MKTIHVRLGGRSYPVMTGHGAVSELPHLIPHAVRRVAVMSQPSVPVDVPLDGYEVHRILVPDGEGAKTLSTVEDVCRDLTRRAFTRSDMVLGVGGGVVTDLAGFVASVYHRGIAVVHVATTLLAQVDAAIGGKTAVNLPEGKNLVGSFWQPAGVICDLDHLATLPPRELKSGLGEVAKYHFLGGSGLRGAPLEDQVAMCVGIKAGVVASDEREGGLRATLNYGHTLAHALEVARRFDLRHGEAVAVGLVFAARLAHRLGRIGAPRVAEHLEVLRDYDLPTRLPADLDPDEVVAIMRRDKKALHGLTFVLDGPNGVEPVMVPVEDVRDELVTMGQDVR